MRFVVDTSEAEAVIERIETLLKSGLPESVFQFVCHGLSSLTASGRDNITILSSGLAPITGDYVMRFGVSRSLELIATALAALESNLSHDDLIY